MCNLHDLGWGTKGDNGSQKDLGGAKTVKDSSGKEVLEVEVPSLPEDVEALWQASRSVLRTPQPEIKEHRDAATKQMDQDKNSRTNVLLAWIGTNMVMIIVCACHYAFLFSVKGNTRTDCIMLIFVVTSTFWTEWAAEHFDNSGGSEYPMSSRLISEFHCTDDTLKSSFQPLSLRAVLRPRRFERCALRRISTIHAAPSNRAMTWVASLSPSSHILFLGFSALRFLYPSCFFRLTRYSYLPGLQSKQSLSPFFLSYQVYHSETFQASFVDWLVRSYP